MLIAHFIGGDPFDYWLQSIVISGVLVLGWEWLNHLLSSRRGQQYSRDR